MQAVVQLNAPPNTPVFTLQARDPDTDHNIHYFIVRDRTGGRFEVDERSAILLLSIQGAVYFENCRKSLKKYLPKVVTTLYRVTQ